MEKKKITNSQELNNYYKLINLKLKKFSEMNIPHNKIASYLKPGSENFNNFIKNDSELNNVEGIETVLKDIIQDTYHAFKDGMFKKSNRVVKTYESLISETIFDGISEITKKDEYEHEKVLSDIYRVSISYIVLLKEKIHLYSVNDNGVMLKVIVFNSEEINKIKEKIVEHLGEDIRKRTTKLLADKVITLNELIGQVEIHNILSEKLTLENIIEYISLNTGLEYNVEYTKSITLNSVEYFLFQVS